MLFCRLLPKKTGWESAPQPVSYNLRHWGVEVECPAQRQRLAGVLCDDQRRLEMAAVFAILRQLDGDGKVRRFAGFPLDDVFDAQIGRHAGGAAPGQRVPFGTAFVDIR